MAADNEKRKALPDEIESKEAKGLWSVTNCQMSR
jgi:hypothetical protein